MTSEPLVSCWILLLSITDSNWFSIFSPQNLRHWRTTNSAVEYNLKKISYKVNHEFPLLVILHLNPTTAHTHTFI